MSTAPTPRPSRGSSSVTVEHLYVLWVVSSLLLVLLAVVIALFSRGQFRRHAERISQQSQAIDELRDDLSVTRQELMNLRATLLGAAPAFRTAPASVQQPGQPARPVQDRPRPPGLGPPTTSAPAEDVVDALLQRALRPGEDVPYELADPAAAEEALLKGLGVGDPAVWSGETWARLAAVACLLDRDELAGIFAASARAANEFPQAYYEISARKLLAQGRATEAIVFLRLLAAGRPDDPSGVLLLAEAYRLNEDLAAADVALEGLDNVEGLSLADQLRLGRLFVALERWDRLDTLLASLGEVSERAMPELNFLRATLAIQRGQLPEALAILDNLLAEQPDDYELRTWRGVTLLFAGQFQAAREALAHAQEQPDRPEAWYWSGMVELQAGNTEEAIAFLEHALAASHAFAPAWEALGTIALNEGDVSTALRNLTNAVNVNPRRAPAHFLLAIVHAKASRPRETADALRTAFRLERSFLDVAKQTEVISRMFSEDELDALASDATVVPPKSPVEPDEAERE